ncbi:MAG: sigma factor-like helix-turn-helix DNA-binding protein [Candidatus Methylomirabilia bacterium]
MRWLESLPPHYRTVIMLSDIEGLSYREIAQVLGCLIGAVMSRLHNARKRLRMLLGPLLALLLALWLGGLP